MSDNTTKIERYSVLGPIPTRKPYQNSIELDEMEEAETKTMRPKSNGWTPEGFMDIQTCHTLTGYHVYYDDELEWILKEKLKQVHPYLLTFTSCP